MLQITENLGNEMIFSLVSSAQEWLNVKWDGFKKEEETRAQKKLQEIEEIERVCSFEFFIFFISHFLY